MSDFKVVQNKSNKARYKRSGKWIDITEYSESWSKGDIFPKAVVKYLKEYEKENTIEEDNQDEELVFGITQKYGDEENYHNYDINDDKPKSTNTPQPPDLSKLGLFVRKSGFDIDYNSFGQQVEGYIGGSIEQSLNVSNDHPIVFINEKAIEENFNFANGEGFYNIKIVEPIKIDDRGRIKAKIKVKGGIGWSETYIDVGLGYLKNAEVVKAKSFSDILNNIGISVSSDIKFDLKAPIVWKVGQTRLQLLRDLTRAWKPYVWAESGILFIMKSPKRTSVTISYVEKFSGTSIQNEPIPAITVKGEPYFEKFTTIDVQKPRQIKKNNYKQYKTIEKTTGNGKIITDYILTTNGAYPVKETKISYDKDGFTLRKDVKKYEYSNDMQILEENTETWHQYKSNGVDLFGKVQTSKKTYEYLTGISGSLMSEKVEGYVVYDYVNGEYMYGIPLLDAIQGHSYIGKSEASEIRVWKTIKTISEDVEIINEDWAFKTKIETDEITNVSKSSSQFVRTTHQRNQIDKVKSKVITELKRKRKYFGNKNPTYDQIEIDFIHADEETANDIIATVSSRKKRELSKYTLKTHFTPDIKPFQMVLLNIKNTAITIFDEDGNSRSIDMDMKIGKSFMVVGYRHYYSKDNAYSELTLEEI